MSATNDDNSGNGGIIKPDDFKDRPSPKESPISSQKATGQRIQCMFCETMASPPLIVKPNEIHLFGFGLQMVDCNGRNLPIGRVICGPCMDILANIVREKRGMPPLVLAVHPLDVPVDSNIKIASDESDDKNNSNEKDEGENSVL